MSTFDLEVIRTILAPYSAICATIRANRASVEEFTRDTASRMEGAVLVAAAETVISQIEMFGIADEASDSERAAMSDRFARGEFSGDNARRVVNVICSLMGIPADAHTDEQARARTAAEVKALSNPIAQEAGLKVLIFGANREYGLHHAL